MAGLLEDSVNQGQSAFQGLGAVAEQAAQNQVRNTELDSARKELARGLVEKLGGTVVSGLGKAAGEITKLVAGTRAPARDTPAADAPPSSVRPDQPEYDDTVWRYPEFRRHHTGDPWTQGIASMFDRTAGGWLNSTAVPIGGNQYGR
jgi:hypothetical protein